MDKPIAIVKKDLVRAIVNAINESNLDICISSMIVKEISDNLIEMSEKDMNVKIALYEASIKEDQNNEKPSDD